MNGKSIEYHKVKMPSQYVINTIIRIVCLHSYVHSNTHSKELMIRCFDDSLLWSFVTLIINLLQLI